MQISCNWYWALYCFYETVSTQRQSNDQWTQCVYIHIFQVHNGQDTIIVSCIKALQIPEIDALPFAFLHLCATKLIYCHRTSLFCSVARSISLDGTLWKYNHEKYLAAEEGSLRFFNDCHWKARNGFCCFMQSHKRVRIFSSLFFSLLLSSG